MSWCFSKTRTGVALKETPGNLYATVLISRGASYLEKLSLIYSMPPAHPRIATPKWDGWRSVQQDAGSAEAPYVKNILDGISGVCTVGAKMKYEDWLVGG